MTELVKELLALNEGKDEVMTIDIDITDEDEYLKSVKRFSTLSTKRSNNAKSNGAPTISFDLTGPVKDLIKYLSAKNGFGLDAKEVKDYYPELF